MTEGAARPQWAPERVDALRLDALAPGMHPLEVHLVDDAASRPIACPVLVARGVEDGPVVGITAAVHGNELNGIATVHRLFRRIDPFALKGTVVGVTIVNVPAYLRFSRTYPHGGDLNRIMPGVADGNESQVYAHRFTTRVLDRFDVLFDLHTASFGRVNTLYIRADMRDEKTAQLARAIGAQIIVHNAGTDGTLRSAVAARGGVGITIEIGDPQVIDHQKITSSRIGIRDALEELGMLAPDDQEAVRNAVECERSFWTYTDGGGLLEVHVPLAAKVDAGQAVATLSDPWGRTLRTYHAPHDAIVVGKSTNPVARSGSRIVHFGIVGHP
ncbi:MAG: succinylglutamate desuccinylase/aspartoacylase family protein [Sandaracinaceae bacterium]